MFLKLLAYKFGLRVGRPQEKICPPPGDGDVKVKSDTGSEEAGGFLRTPMFKLSHVSQHNFIIYMSPKLTPDKSIRLDHRNGEWFINNMRVHQASALYKRKSKKMIDSLQLPLHLKVNDVITVVGKDCAFMLRFLDFHPKLPFPVDNDFHEIMNPLLPLINHAGQVLVSFPLREYLKHSNWYDRLLKWTIDSSQINEQGDDDDDKIVEYGRGVNCPRFISCV